MLARSQSARLNIPGVLGLSDDPGIRVFGLVKLWTGENPVPGPLDNGTDQLLADTGTHPETFIAKAINKFTFFCDKCFELYF